MSKAESSKTLEQKGVEVIKSVVVDEAIGFFGRAFPSADSKLIDLLKAFSETAKQQKHTPVEIGQAIETTAHALPGETKLSIELTLADFSSDKFHMVCGVGENTGEPEEVYFALLSLWEFSRSNNYNTDSTIFGKDGRAHIIYALLRMGGHVFSLSNPAQKKSWLELISLFIGQAQDSAASKRMMGNDAFYTALESFKTIVDHSAKEAEKVRGNIKDHLTSIKVDTVAAWKYMRAILPIHYKDSNSAVRYGSARSEHYNKDLICILSDAVGFTLPDVKGPEHRALPTFSRPKTQVEIFTKTTMAQIIAWGEFKGEAVPDDKGFPQGLAHTGIAELSKQEKRIETARFLTALETLSNADDKTVPRLRLLDSGQIVLTVQAKKASDKEKEILSFSSSNEKEIISFDSGIQHKFLSIDESRIPLSVLPASRAAHRKIILATDIEKAKIVNAVTSLLDLCDDVITLCGHYGDAYAALFLQSLFPSMKQFIKVAKLHYTTIDDNWKYLSKSNPTVIGRRLKTASNALKQFEYSLVNMGTSVENAGKLCEKTLEELAKGNISLQKDLARIIKSLGNCKDLFEASKLLETGDKDDIESSIKAIQDDLDKAKEHDESIQLTAQKKLEEKERPRTYSNSSMQNPSSSLPPVTTTTSGSVVSVGTVTPTPSDSRVSGSSTVSTTSSTGRTSVSEFSISPTPSNENVTAQASTKEVKEKNLQVALDSATELAATKEEENQNLIQKNTELNQRLAIYQQLAVKNDGSKDSKDTESKDGESKKNLPIMEKIGEIQSLEKKIEDLKSQQSKISPAIDGQQSQVLILKIRNQSIQERVHNLEELAQPKDAEAESYQNTYFSTAFKFLGSLGGGGATIGGIIVAGIALGTFWPVGVAVTVGLGIYGTYRWFSNASQEKKLKLEAAEIRRPIPGLMDEVRRNEVVINECEQKINEKNDEYKQQDEKIKAATAELEIAKEQLKNLEKNPGAESNSAPVGSAPISINHEEKIRISLNNASFYKSISLDNKGTPENKRIKNFIIQGFTALIKAANEYSGTASIADCKLKFQPLIQAMTELGINVSKDAKAPSLWDQKETTASLKDSINRLGASELNNKWKKFVAVAIETYTIIKRETGIRGKSKAADALDKFFNQDEFKKTLGDLTGKTIERVSFTADIPAKSGQESVKGTINYVTMNDGVTVVKSILKDMSFDAYVKDSAPILSSTMQI